MELCNSSLKNNYGGMLLTSPIRFVNLTLEIIGMGHCLVFSQEAKSDFLPPTHPYLVKLYGFAARHAHQNCAVGPACLRCYSQT